MAASGEIWIDVNWEELTNIVAVPLTEPNCAVILVLPSEFAITLPPLFTVATVDADEVQSAIFVITWVLPSLKVAVATKFRDVVGARTAVAGVTEIEDTVAAVTVNRAEPETPLNVAEMLAVPGPSAIAVPADPTMATTGLSELHIESIVMT